MHDVLDTEQIDYRREKPWPQNYKAFIRDTLGRHLADEFFRQGTFRLSYERCHQDIFATYEELIDSISGRVIAGAERCVDRAFERMVDAFKSAVELPSVHPYKNHLWPFPLPDDLTYLYFSEIVSEYSKEHILEHIFEDHYQDRYESFNAFIHFLGMNMVVGLLNGAEDTLGEIYRSFILGIPLPVARRSPQILKTW